MDDHPIPYEEVSSAELGQRATDEMSYLWDPPEKPQDAIFTGPCPRCQHQMTYNWPLVVVRDLIAPAAAEELEITVICSCTEPHPGAGEHTGCGAYWTLTVPGPG